MRHERALLDPDDASLDRSFAAGMGYGSDPNLITPSSPWPCIVSDHQLRLIDRLCDIILPGDHHIPNPSQMAISSFFNNWLSATYAKQTADRVLVENGLAWLDYQSTKQYGADFLNLTRAQRIETV